MRKRTLCLGEKCWREMGRARSRLRLLHFGIRRFAAGASRCLGGEWRTGGAAAVAAQILRGLESNCVPQRAGNGSARGPAVETRDTGEFEHRASRCRAEERI